MAADDLSLTFAALADPTRRAILEHLKVLERAGLISRGKEAQWRPARLRGRSLGDAADWLDRYRVFWEGSFDRLDEHLRRIQSKGTTTKEHDDEH